MNVKWGMIKTDGGLWTGPERMIRELEKLGWLYVVNPKRNYYIEKDQTLPTYKKEQNSDEEIDELQVEVL